MKIVIRTVMMFQLTPLLYGVRCTGTTTAMIHCTFQKITGTVLDSSCTVNYAVQYSVLRNLLRSPFFRSLPRYAPVIQIDRPPSLPSSPKSVFVGSERLGFPIYRADSIVSLFNLFSGLCCIKFCNFRSSRRHYSYLAQLYCFGS